jgi:hypothetical protein
MLEVLYIKKCLQLIEKKVNRGSSRHWTQEDYLKIQKLIFDASSIQLSNHTLQRLFGKIRMHKNYKPQLDTKNGLAIFLGYTDWENFINENPLNPQEMIEISEGETSSARKEILVEAKSDQKTTISKLSVVLITICTAIAIVTTFIKYTSPSEKILFKAVNTYGKAPHTVKFVYQVSGSPQDHYSIYFPEDEKTLEISPTKSTYYYAFLNPGRYTALLLKNNKTIARTNIYVQTQGWLGQFSKHAEVGRKTPFDTTLLISKGRLFTPLAALPDSIRTTYPILSYSNIRDLKVDGDNVIFETRFRNQARPGNLSCHDMWFMLMGTEGLLKMHFLASGCFAYVDAVFGEKVLTGAEQDLSSFTTDVQSWKKARLEVIDRTVRIYLGDSLIYKTSYSKSVGKIVGLEVINKTSGETDYVRLYNAKKQLVYEDDFGGEATD